MFGARAKPAGSESIRQNPMVRLVADAGSIRVCLFHRLVG